MTVLNIYGTFLSRDPFIFHGVRLVFIPVQIIAEEEDDMVILFGEVDVFILFFLVSWNTF